MMGGIPSKFYVEKLVFCAGKTIHRSNALRQARSFHMVSEEPRSNEPPGHFDSAVAHHLPPGVEITVCLFVIPISYLVMGGGQLTWLCFPNVYVVPE